MEHALDQPAGCAAIVVADSPASMPLWVARRTGCARDLPPDVQETLTRHEEAGTTDDPEYEAAVRVFYDRHLCRSSRGRTASQRSFAQMDADPTVYHTMNGPSEFHVVGSLKDWDITDRLHEITTPTLLVSGRYDEATPHIVGQIHERIPGAEWEIFEESSHMPHVEEPEAFLERVEDVPEDGRLTRWRKCRRARSSMTVGQPLSEPGIRRFTSRFRPVGFQIVGRSASNGTSTPTTQAAFGLG